MVFLSIYRLNFLFQILWKKTNPITEIKIIYKDNAIKNVKIEEKDFIGNFSQLPNSLKLYTSIQNLIFKEHYTTHFRIPQKDYE
jgi:hypothetical protein